MSVSNLFRDGRKPNILIIITDQERALRHWPESFSRDHLPAMERLKRHGLEFKHHYTNATMCSPSRSTLLTSQFPAKTGVTRTGSPGPPRHMPTTLPNLATILKQAGYPRVEWHGKWHVGKTPAEYGFQGWEPPDAGNYLAVNDTLGGGTPDNDGRFLENLCHSLERYSGGTHNDATTTTTTTTTTTNTNTNNTEIKTETETETASENKNVIENTDNNSLQGPQQPGGEPDSEESPTTATAATGKLSEPFCLVASFVNPHDVYVAQHGPAKGYTHEDLHRIKVPLPENYMEDTDENNKPRAHGQMSSRCVPFDCTHQEYVNFYAHLHTLVDARIGALLDKVDDLGFTESTLIFRTADHGEQGLSHSLVEKFFNCYQESLNIPLIVSNPIAYPEPQSTDALSSHLDLLPTLAGLLGQTDTTTTNNNESTKDLRGKDLTPVLDDPGMMTTVVTKTKAEAKAEAKAEVEAEAEAEAEVEAEMEAEAEAETNASDSNGDRKSESTQQQQQQQQQDEIVEEIETFPGIQKSIHFTYDDISFPGAPSTIRCLHKGIMKYAVYFTPDGRDADWELYDLRKDPLEDTNLAGKPDYKKVQTKLEKELYETMVDHGTLPKGFDWPPNATPYSMGFDHPPGHRPPPPRRRPPPRKDPVTFYRFLDGGDVVVISLGIEDIGTKCTEEDDIEVIVGPNASMPVLLVIKNYDEEEMTLSFGPPKAEITEIEQILEEDAVTIIMTKKDPAVVWKSFNT